MATVEAPVLPLEIWAESDLVLPNSGRQNKVRPIDDLWQKGWDKGQKPDCEAFNYLLNLYGQWLQYVLDRVDSESADFLRTARNLADVLNKAEARKNLDVYSKGEAKNAFVNVTGDTMTGPLSLSRINFTGADSTDFFWLECHNHSDLGTSHLDFVLGDDPVKDQIRFRGSRSKEADEDTIFNIMTVEITPDKNSGTVVIYDALAVKGSISVPSLTVTNGAFSKINTSGEGMFGSIKCHDTAIDGGGTTTGFLRVPGECNVNQLIVVNNHAVVAGKHVVRTVNGVDATAEGVVNIPAVQDVRLTSNTWYAQPDGGATWNWQTPAGAVMTGINPQDTGNNSADNIGGVHYAFVQKLVNGVWYNVTRA